MIYNIDEIVDSNWGAFKQFNIENSFREATALIDRVVKRGGVGLVYGPPGTGKTTVYEYTIANMVESMPEDEWVIYIAPTNHLLADMLGKLTSVYSRYGKTMQDLKSELRVYGSRFYYAGYEELRDKVDDKTRFILTTSYQNLPRIKYGARLHIMVDEASKSPLHSSFIPLAQNLIEHREEELMVSFNVVGDPNQAIGISDEYRGRRDLLLLPRLTAGLLKKETNQEISYDDVERLIDAADKHLNRHFAMLKLTYRLPEPTERPISSGFYVGKLKAKESAARRLHGLWDDAEAQKLKTIDDSMSRVVDVLEQAITTDRALIYFETTQKSYGFAHDILFDEKRAEVGLYTAVALASITKKPVLVIATYIDQAEQMKQLFNRDFKSRFKQISNLITFSTVHRILGSESDNVVAILGKEYSSTTEPTIYFNEPELLNVQLSRHKRVIALIGNLQRLIKTAKKLNQRLQTRRYSSLRKTAESVYELCGIEFSRDKIVARKDSNGGVFYKWKA